MGERYKHPPPTWFLAPFGGLDRAYFDPDPNFGHLYYDTKLKKKVRQTKPIRPTWTDRQVRVEWILEWYKHLYDNSNFQFSGAYLSGEDPTQPSLGTGGSRNEVRGWRQNWGALLEQGWGLWPIYPAFANVGKTSGQEDVKLPLDWNETRIARGVSAGIHIKFLTSKLPKDNNGMVVYIDNENGSTETMIPYYRAMFQEMQTDRGDGRPPVRAGLYIRRDDVNRVLEAFPDVFLWLIETETKDVKPVPYGKPYLTPVQRDATGQSRFEIERYPITRWQAHYMPVGRQCTLIGESEGYTKSIILSVGKGDTKALSIPGWDFDVSFVRDPRFPQGGPRFACHSEDPIVYSAFAKSGVTVAELGSQAFSVKEIEADAPLSRLGQELYSIDRSGNVVSTSKPAAKASDWTRWETVVPQGDLRRIRALSIARVPGTEFLMFWITTKNKIYVHRRLDPVRTQRQPNQWESLGVWEVGDVHPFTNISSVLFKGRAWIFFMQKMGDNLSEASLSVTPWHAQGSTQLGPALKGTHVATVATENWLLVFTINKDRYLQFTHAHLDPKTNTPVFSGLRNALIVTSKSGPNEPKMHPHTRIAACIRDPMSIRVAAFASDGIPCVFDIVFIAGAARWERAGCTLHPISENQTVRTTSTPRGFIVSKAWTFNPYGDIALVQKDARSELYCAGACPDRSGVLLRRIGEKEPWLRMDT
ncbi:hypothetical protein BDV95DRAFT_611332 [Massariosphaeria phaeospora]|uniref:Fucose-specific lectin n=1 Tax=Massariosphaeria phaeospora TaxID=100035 RepID=A0A7C8I1D9_9PLEO|nr:hypothetical protein BDV95DRAFT_611332 [Massariosphaeria phaeospora]